MIKYNINVCDNIDYDLEIHFTKACENNCAFCIDKLNKGLNVAKKPDIDKIFLAILEQRNKFNYIGIAGGEPFLYINELLELCKRIKKYFPNVKLNIITSVPEICYKEQEKFFEIINLCDSIGISPQHYKQDIADKIRCKKSNFDRLDFYEKIPYKYKITLNINAIKGYLDTLEDIKQCILYFSKIGYSKFKLCELSQRETLWVGLENILGIKLKSPFAHGCSIKNFNIKKWIPEFNGELTLKRTCFYNNSNLHANLADLFKICTRWIFRKKFFFAVIYENGQIFNYWR